mgnify:CR=1 FL=1
MTNQDKPRKDTLSFKLDSDEIDRRSNRESSAKVKAKSNMRESSRKTRGGVGILWFILIVVIIGGAGGGYQLFTLNQQMEMALLKSVDRIQSLEQQLSVTDENISQSDVAREVKLNKLGSEVRKLWDVSNKRNKAWIQENKTGLSSVKGGVASLKKDISIQKKSITTLKTQLKQKEVLEKLIADTGSRLKVLEASVASQSYADNDTVDAIKTKVSILSSSQDILKSSLEARLKEAEQAIDAFDSQRLQINRSLQELKAQLKAQLSVSAQKGAVVNPVVAPK